MDYRHQIERAAAQAMLDECDRLLADALRGVAVNGARYRRTSTFAQRLREEQEAGRFVEVAPGVELLVEDDQ
ncbi:MAG: hypothetical protein ACTHMU_05785 [Thermomicrobiales bacterium]